MFNNSADKLQNLLVQYKGNKDDVDQKKAYINEKYRKIRSRLTDKQADMEDISKKVKVLDEDLKDCHQFISDINKRAEPFFDKKTIPKDDAKLKESVDEIDGLINELTSQKGDLQKDYEIGDSLIERSKRDPLVLHEVKSRLAEVQTPIDEIIDKLNVRKAKLVNECRQHQALTEKVDDLDNQLRNLDERITCLQPVSAKLTLARGQQEQFKVIVVNLSKFNSLMEIVKRTSL